jgi:hypothetical protein
MNKEKAAASKAEGERQRLSERPSQRQVDAPSRPRDGG